MVDCRNLIEFCQAFDQHKSMTSSINSSRNNKHIMTSSINPKYHPFCSQSPFAVVDIIILLLVIGSLGFLIIPYITTIYHQSLQIVIPLVIETIADIIIDAPIGYFIGLIAAFSGVIVSIVVWEIMEVKYRKCGRVKCKGYRKAVEFDIQLESEECVKYLSMKQAGECNVKPLEVGKDYKELEAELRKMAPVNGRTVVVFRARCGCVAGRLEVWGPKWVRRVKK